MKTIVTLICTLALAGCGGNQQKLEECMAEAAYMNYKVHEAGKQERREAEDRCVKLYK